MQEPHDPSPSRRGLLKGGASAFAVAFAGPIAALASRTAQASSEACVAANASVQVASPYGPLAPVNDLTTGLPLIQLPAGFSYKSYGWRGDVMADGLITPAAHDGMGVVRARRVGRSLEIVLVRNHELSTSTDASRIIGASLASVAKYDTALSAWAHDLAARRGKKVAVVAVARRLARILFALWRDGRDFVEPTRLQRRAA